MVQVLLLLDPEIRIPNSSFLTFQPNYSSSPPANRKYSVCPS